MNLTILLPYQVFLQAGNLEEIVAETTQGSMGFLPRRLDCIAILVPGILTYRPVDKDSVYVAVDSGVIVKTGADISVSVRRAVIGPDLQHLRAEVENHFLQLDDEERKMRTALAKIERGFVRQFREVLRER